MARGVSKDFINLLFDDANSSRSRVIVSAVILAVLTGLAAYLWLPWGLAVHGGAVLVGLGMGWLIGNGAVGRFEGSIRGEWNKWMQLSPACDTVSEVGRKVKGRRAANRAYVIAAVLTLLWAAELLMVAFAFDGQTGWPIAVAIGANGVFAGALLGHQLRLMTWTKGFATSLAEMVRDGELGVWGVR